MKKELLNKEVFCIIDTRQIQKYLFYSNGDIDHYGASYVLRNIISEALEYAVKNIDEPYDKEKYIIKYNIDDDKIHFLHDKNIQMEVVTNVAGNALILFRTGRICQKIIRKVARWYLERTYCLDLAVGVIEKTDVIANDLDKLYDQLDMIKADFSTAHPQYPWPIVQVEKSTGDPSYKIEKNGEVISKASYARREAAKELPYISEMSEIKTQVGPRKKRYVAVGHMDGNNMGLLLSKIFHNDKITYEKGIKIRRQVDKNIAEGFTNLLNSTIERLKKEFFPCGITDDEFGKYFVIHRGGDDINFICTPFLAIPFVKYFMEDVKSICLYKDDTNNFTLSVCAGIVYMNQNNPFITAFDYAEESCAIAKKRGKAEKNLINGFCGNWVDFEILQTDENQNIEAKREKLYKTNDMVNLTQRPLAMDAVFSDTNYYLPNIIKKASIIKNMNMPPQYFEIFERSYAVGLTEYNSFIEILEKNGYHLREMLGKPLSKDGGKTLANWYDATELSYFLDKKDV